MGTARLKPSQTFGGSSAISFQKESWKDLERDGQELFAMNFAELGLNKDKVFLAPNSSLFEEIDQKGVLHIITARKDGKLVGYHISALLPHMHYRDAGMMGYTDAYYVHPEHRKGGLGAKLLIEVERTLRERGATKFYISTKAHSDNSELFEALGYSFTDKVFTKMLI
jgi:GNAT superfamily N-acetyltransferase